LNELAIEIDELDTLLVNVPAKTLTPRAEMERQVQLMASDVGMIFGADADPAELQTFYRATGQHSRTTTKLPRWQSRST
jgi:hypothetical protein